MSRFRQLSQTVWHCQYHIIWTPKYHYQILTGDIAQYIDNCVRGFSELKYIQESAKVYELNMKYGLTG